MREEVLTLLAFTDLHGRVLEWDYLDDAPPTEPGSLARISTLVNRIRVESTASLLFDVGDTIQGTAMMTLAAREQTRPHPMSVALNHLGVDVACVGNHELNFGLDHLRAYADACFFPVLAANLHGAQGIAERALIEVAVGSLGTVTVGVIGLTTPGSAIWDRPHLEGKASVGGIAESAAEQVNALRAAGADLVIALSHSGLGPSSTYGDGLPWPENDTRLLIRQTPGIDAVFLGHEHVEKIGHEQCLASGIEVPYVEPLCFGRRLGRIDLTLSRTAEGRIEVIGSTPQSLPVADAAPDPSMSGLLTDAHERTRAYGAKRIGVAAEAIAAWPVTLGPSPALDLVNAIQSAAVSHALTPLNQPRLRVLSATALFGAHDGLPAGPLSIRNLNRLYPFENLLQAVELSTTQLLAYLEHNALGFGISDVPSYNVDSLGSAEHDVSYLIDADAAPGSRVSELRIDGAAPDPDERFVLALSSYRASGGGAFPATAGNPLVYDAQAEVRDLLIGWIRERGTVRLDDIRRTSWRVRQRTPDWVGRSDV